MNQRREGEEMGIEMEEGRADGVNELPFFFQVIFRLSFLLCCPLA